MYFKQKYFIYKVFVWRFGKSHINWASFLNLEYPSARQTPQDADVTVRDKIHETFRTTSRVKTFDLKQREVIQGFA